MVFSLALSDSVSHLWVSSKKMIMSALTNQKPELDKNPPMRVFHLVTAFLSDITHRAAKLMSLPGLISGNYE